MKNQDRRLPPRIGLTRLRPVLNLLAVSRGTFEAGIRDGTFPPPRVPARKPGASGLWDAAQAWAVVAGEDWRQANSANQQINDD